MKEIKESLVSHETAVLAIDKGYSFLKGEYFHQAMLQKWLREEKNIDVVAIPVRFTGYLEIGYYTYMVCGIQPMKNYRFDTYEEALEIALVEGLNLIIL